ncbi:MAG: HD domain-containing phosphohydrolase [Thermodesulfobacteriota bacterium]
MENRNILIVDDDPGVLGSLQRELRRESYSIHTADSALLGLEILQGQEIGVVLTDQMMPGMDGISFLETVRELRPEAVRLLITGNGSLQNAMAAVNRSKVFAYLTKPWSSEELKSTLRNAFEHHNLVRENRRLHDLTRAQNERLRVVNGNLDRLVAERTAQLEEAIQEGVFMLALAAEAKDDDTGEHVYRIQRLTSQICTGLGMAPKLCADISFFSIMHDVGKIHVPDHILKKQGSLDPEEWELMRSHTVVGEKILGNKEYYLTARQIARSHHEHWDGTGYPDGLKGAEIPVSARITAVADVFDALTHARPYKRAWSVEEAVSEVKSRSGLLFDPEIVGAFLKVIRHGASYAP